MQQENGWMPANNENPDKNNERNATSEQQPSDQPYQQSPPAGQPYQQQPSGQPYQQPPAGQPYQQPPSGQPYQQPPAGQPYQQPPVGQPYQQPPVGQPYQQPPVGQPYQQPPVGQPSQQPQQFQQPVGQPQGYQPVAAEPGALGGLQANMASMLSYLFGWVTGLIFFFGDKRPEVRFHAAQSIIATGALSILSLLLNGLLAMSWRLWWLLSIVNTLISLAALALIVYCMISAYNGKRVKLPIAGDFAEKMVK